MSSTQLNGIKMTEEEFEALQKTHSVIAYGWSSANLSCVSVIGNEHGTPIAMSYMSSETDGELKYINLLTPKTIDATVEVVAIT